MIAMQKYAKDISKRFDVEEFYGRLESAVDTDTRYFTNDSFGPLGVPFCLI
jgi:hypothetical protein